MRSHRCMAKRSSPVPSASRRKFPLRSPRAAAAFSPPAAIQGRRHRSIPSGRRAAHLCKIGQSPPLLFAPSSSSSRLAVPLWPSVTQLLRGYESRVSPMHAIVNRDCNHAGRRLWWPSLHGLLPFLPLAPNCNPRRKE
ncbi:Translation initiation factor IF-2, mitochondrial [Sesbania bispinosa]|nr:Translation initiation factor IF-2, mitochondrial [Sesbania bispinosa]